MLGSRSAAAFAIIRDGGGRPPQLNSLATMPIIPTTVGAMRSPTLWCLRRRKLACGVLAVVLSLSPLAGCYWLRYREISSVHKDLMLGLSEDARDAYLSKTVHLTASDITRLAYPLERSRGFLRIVLPRRPDSAVLASLARMTEAYSALVEYLDSVRGGPPNDAARARVIALADGVIETAGDLQLVLDSGQS